MSSVARRFRTRPVVELENLALRHQRARSPAITLAERLGGARDRFDPLPVLDHIVIFNERHLRRFSPRMSLLPTHPHTSVARQGLLRLTPDHATQDRKGGRDPESSVACITATNASPPDSSPIPAYQW
jgi:hypothetical protein